VGGVGKGNHKKTDPKSFGGGKCGKIGQTAQTGGEKRKKRREKGPKRGFRKLREKYRALE